ncbi:hypothetical protein H310_12333 [Aphanomyces invadans]|uniref:Reverse transcriptase domain-containing protein n=1 Tax=Aphanomyces invadans TaxID=157072 RepID=A0A024TK90_9STRA|nr:hypothetical protein H310_12333 [Aphanomyces invadans]ETV93767.1 hypothetical protein H310_12333 [Aphanomyces invadans]|eukprot:XP_008877576.1 hypothetical protein H310_12333 [Aphanomyces invadans]
MPMLEVIVDHLAVDVLVFTDTGVYTPTRVLMGGTDSLAYCQSSVQEMFATELYKSLLIWLDVRGIKLNPKKCRFYEIESRWFWRILSSDGVKQDPERIKELQDLKMPPMTDLMESVYKAACGRTRPTSAKATLADVGWSAAHAACLTACKQALSCVVTLAHPKQDRLICVLAEASDLHWGDVVTQIPHDHVDRELRLKTMSRSCS